MSDKKISPIQIVKQTVGLLHERPRKTSLLLLLLACFYGLEESVVGDIPPDPFAWLLLGAPFIALFAPIAVLAFYHLLGGAGEIPKALPDSFTRKCVKFFMYFVGFEIVQGVATAVVPFAALLMLPLFESAGKDVVDMMAGIIGLALLIPVFYQILKRILVFPGLVAEKEFSLNKSSQLMEGHVLRLIASFIILLLPFVLIVLLLDLAGLDVGEVKVGEDVRLLPLLLSSILSSLASIVVISGLCSWYEKLKVCREAMNETYAE